MSTSIASERAPAATPLAPDLRIRWLGTASFELCWGSARAVLDPFLTRPPGAAFPAPCSSADLAGTTWLFVSHGHFDHSYDAAAVARASSCETYAPRVVCRRLAREGVPTHRLHANEDHREIDHRGAHMTILPSRHIRFDRALVARTVSLVLRGGALRPLLPLLTRYPAGRNSDLLLRLGPHRVLFSGSGGGDVDALARVRPTCYLLPFAGRSDVCDYYLAVLRALRPKQVVLHHFDVFYPSFAIEYPVDEMRRKLARELPDIELTVPVPGRWLSLTPPNGRTRRLAREPDRGDRMKA